MSEIAAQTYVLYGTEIDVTKFDKERFENLEEYINHIYDVINKDDSPFTMIYDEFNDKHFFGYVLDKAEDSKWQTQHLNTVSFTSLQSEITTDVKEALDWILLVYFGTRSRDCNVDYWILSVY